MCDCHGQEEGCRDQQTRRSINQNLCEINQNLIGEIGMCWIQPKAVAALIQVNSAWGNMQGKWLSDLEQELSTLGLRCKRITADGNCFFR